jgi:hypothetical protein
VHALTAAKGVRPVAKENITEHNRAVHALTAAKGVRPVAKENITEHNRAVHARFQLGIIVERLVVGQQMI